jgi:predicted  nucleic acid-binding Zn-ribbon protein
MSNTANPPTAPSWQAALVSLEAQFLEIWRLGKEQVKQVQAKRQSARAAAARLAEAERRLAAGESQKRESDKLVPLRKAAQDAKEAHQQALADYEDALKVFHKQRARLHEEREALSRRREALSGTLPPLVRQAYRALLGDGVPDPVAVMRENQCLACGHHFADEVSAEALVCPSCKRLMVQTAS